MLLGSNEIIIIKNHPKTCCFGVFKKNDTFAIDKNIENELMITSAPDGYLKRVK